MPLSSNPPPNPSRPKANYLSTSPDTDSPAPQQETPPKKGKKNKKNAVSVATRNQVPPEPDRGLEEEIASVVPSPPTHPQPIPNQIPRGFPTRRKSGLSDVQHETTTSEKVSDQYTPPNDNWLQDAIYGKAPPGDDVSDIGRTISPAIEPGFSTRGTSAVRSPPTSPPQRQARPVSYGNGMSSLPPYARMSSSPYGYAPSAYGSPNAPPHMPQQHFYNAQDVDLGLVRGGDPQHAEEPTLVKQTVLPSKFGCVRRGAFLGFDGRLNVLAVDGNKTEEIGALAGISGSIIDVALLEWRSGPDPFSSLRPLVAVVSHGPRDGLQSQPDSRGEDVIVGEVRPVPLHGLEYSTRVDIYSLSSQRHISRLLETPPTPLQPGFRGAPPSLPKPAGSLKLHAKGSYLVVASGVSGEVFTFGIRNGDKPGFELIGKFWTLIQPQIQRRDSSHSRGSDVDISPADLGRGLDSTELALTTLSGRWLALCPVGSPSRPSLAAALGPDIVCRGNSGFDTAIAPGRPPINCEVDSPDADTLLGKVARGVAQELVKGARWLGDQGYQTWQSYWKKDPSSPSAGPIQTYSPTLYPAQHLQGQFPPTHADAVQAPKEPELVAIYDLQALQELLTRKQSEEIKPIAIFQPPRGCSYISFSPNGLNLLTAGRKGDVQYVWDLMQVQYCRASITTMAEDRGSGQPRARQIARYERLSGSTIVDVVWDTPIGARFAVLTKNRTIHVFDLPRSAFKWPPSRTQRRPRPSSRSIDTGAISNTIDTAQPVGFFASAMSIANKAQPMMTNWRGRAPSIGGGFAGIGQTGIGLASATGARGTKAVAAGLSKSLGAASETVNHIRHAGESRLHLKSTKDALGGRVFWTSRDHKPCLAILDSDLLRMYHIRRSKSQDKRHRETTSVFDARRAVNIKLPKSFELRYELSGVHGKADHSESYSGYWKSRETTSVRIKTMPHPLSFAEIETNAPYQPFHSDHRVTISIYSDQIPLIAHQSVPHEPARSNSRRKNQSPKKVDQWVFGDEIPATKLNIAKGPISDDEDNNTGSVMYRETSVTSPASGKYETEQIVSTTRCKKSKKMTTISQTTGSDVEGEDGFFEDDCDVLDFATDRV